MAGTRLRIPMVIARPGGTDDVGYRTVARLLMARLDAGEPFGAVHFDRHGNFAGRSASSPAWGRLLFETAGDTHAVLAETMAAVVAAAGVPAVASPDRGSSDPHTAGDRNGVRT